MGMFIRKCQHGYVIEAASDRAPGLTGKRWAFSTLAEATAWLEENFDKENV